MAIFLAKLGIKIHQLDVTSAYLNGKFDEKIFLECPDYFDKILELIINEIFDSDISRKAAKILKKFNEENKLLFLITLWFKTSK